MISPLSFASKNHGAERGYKDGKGWLKKMDLSESQLNEIKAIKESGKSNMKTQREAIKKEKEALKVLIKGPASNSKVRSQHNKIQKLKRSLEDKRFDNFLKIRKIVPVDKRQHLKLPKGKKHGRKGMKKKNRE